MPLVRSSDQYHALMFKRPTPARPGFWTRPDIEPHVPEGTSLDAPLPAFVNGGRWIVQCPCGAGILVAENVDKVFCVNCLNEAVGGQWRRVTWPVDAALIEAELLKRPLLASRNWLPTETVDELIAENVVHQVITIDDIPKGRKTAVLAIVNRKPDKTHEIAPGTLVHPKSERAK